MNTSKIFACVSVLLLLGGCASSKVTTGALVGALSGAAVGTGLGYVLSEPDLLGPDNEGAGGDTSLPVGRSTLAGGAIGLLVGGIVGAMVGHQRDDGYEMPQRPVPSSEPSAEEQARAPYLRGM
jgi:hypothetical protein